MPETSAPRAGQFWTMETNGHRVLTDSATQYSLDATVTVRDIDGDGTLAQVRVEWFVNHATLLHDSLTAAWLEAHLDEAGLAQEHLTEAALGAVLNLIDRLDEARSTIRSRDEQMSRQAVHIRELSEKLAQHVAYVKAAEGTIEVLTREAAKREAAIAVLREAVS